MKRVLIFQHAAAEHAGRFGEFLEQDGVERHVVKLNEGDTIPAVDTYDGLVVLGGPQQVWEEDKFPWLADEKIAIKSAVVDHSLPFLGLCLGHQLLAEALGGTVQPSKRPEVGVLPVGLTEEGSASPFMKGLKPELQCVQGHGAEVIRPPDGARVLARSPDCAVQAMQVGQRAISLQFHMELTPEMVEDCLCIPEYQSEFEAAMGSDGVVEFVKQTRDLAPVFEADARSVYRNWREACG